MDESRPTPRLLLVGMLVGTALMSYAAGALTINHSKPATWEECMVANLDKARVDGALGIINKYCKAYPRRSKDAS